MKAHTHDAYMCAYSKISNKKCRMKIIILLKKSKNERIIAYIAHSKLGKLY